MALLLLPRQPTLQASEFVITNDNCYILLLHKQYETGFLPFGVKGN